MAYVQVLVKMDKPKWSKNQMAHYVSSGLFSHYCQNKCSSKVQTLSVQSKTFTPLFFQIFFPLKFTFFCVFAFFAFFFIFLHFCVFFFNFLKIFQNFFSRNFFLDFFSRNFFLQNFFQKFSRIFGENFKSLAQKMAELLSQVRKRTLYIVLYIYDCY